MANLNALHAGGWEEIELPDIVEQYPTMLTYEERRLLFWLARDVWEGWGAIVDAGAFVGGSTASLATGVRARTTPTTDGGPQPPMWTYDLFVAEGYELGYFERWPQIRAGDSFRPAFDELLGDLARETRVHEGDISAQRWSGGPIEILFLDVLKTTGINDAVLPQFMPSLVGGRSVLIQQDYVHGFLPWIHVTMELLADSVEHVADVAASRVYAVTRDIPAERLAAILPLDQRVPAEQQQALVEQAVAASAGDTRGMLLVVLANLLCDTQDRLTTAASLLTHVERHFSDVPSVMADMHATRAKLIDRGWAPT